MEDSGMSLQIGRVCNYGWCACRIRSVAIWPCILWLYHLYQGDHIFQEGCTSPTPPLPPPPLDPARGFIVFSWNVLAVTPSEAALNTPLVHFAHRTRKKKPSPGGTNQLHQSLLIQHRCICGGSNVGDWSQIFNWQRPFFHLVFYSGDPLPNTHHVTPTNGTMQVVIDAN